MSIQTVLKCDRCDATMCEAPDDRSEDDQFWVFSFSGDLLVKMGRTHDVSDGVMLVDLCPRCEAIVRGAVATILDAGASEPEPERRPKRTAAKLKQQCAEAENRLPVAIVKSIRAEQGIDVEGDIRSSRLRTATVEGYLSVLLAEVLLHEQAQDSEE